MPDKVGRFQLYSDTSKYAMGSSLYQIQNGKPKLITYVSKEITRVTLQHLVLNYSITELDLKSTVVYGLAINIARFCTFIEKSGFQCSGRSFGYNTLL